MKKSLSAILSLAMAFSMFSSVVSAAEDKKTSDDFSDLKDLTAEQKKIFDEMIGAGIFDGVADGVFGLKDKMNRAQFAKVAALIFDLDVDTSLKTSSFSDVKADDPANGYALPYIEALVKAGITDGYAPGEFNPAGEVTKEQLAAFLLRGLGLDSQAKATPGVSDKTVSDWAKGYVALAIQKGILSSGENGEFGGTSAATRDLLVLSSYEAKKQYVPPVGKAVAVLGVEATDASELTVNFSAPVSGEVKASNFEVKRDGTIVDIDSVKLSDDKKKAIITLKSKLVDAKYSVTVSDIEKLDSSKTSAEVQAEAEKITKIEFLTASDTIAQAKKVPIEFQAINQYGKKSSKTSNDFEIRISDRDIEDTYKPKANESAFTIDTFIPDEDSSSKNERNLLRAGDRFTINIYSDEFRVQATKIFTIGDEARVTKIEFGDLVDKNGKKIDYIKAEEGDKAYIKYNAYDQYGFKVITAEQLNDSVNISTTNRVVEAQNDEGDRKAPFVPDVDGDEADDLQLVYVESDEERQVDTTVTVTAFAGGSTVSKDIKVAAIKQPASIEFASFTGTIADGDKEKALKLIVKDSNGDELTAQEIKDAASKFRVYSTGAIDIPRDSTDIENGIALTGEDVGKLIIEGRGTGASSVEISLREKPEVKAKINLSVSKQRYPDSVKISSELASTVLVGGYDEFKVKTYDQYGEVYEWNYSEDDYEVKMSLEAIGSAQAATISQGDTTVLSVDSSKRTAEKVSLFKTSGEYQESSDYKYEYFDKTLKFNGSAEGIYRVKFELLKDGKTTGQTLTKNVEVITGRETNQDLNYSVSLDKSVEGNKIAAVTDLVDDGADIGELTVGNSVYGANNAEAIYKEAKPLTKEIKIKAKDKSGNSVSVDGSSTVQSVSSDNKAIADVYQDGSKWYVVGKRAGKANLSVRFTTPKGTETASVQVESVNEAPAAASISLKKTAKGINASQLNGLYVWNEVLAEELKVIDQYGGEYKIEKANSEQQYIDKGFGILSVDFAISDIKYRNTSGTPDALNITKNGKIEFTRNSGDIESFKIKVYTPNGKSAVIDVIVQ